MLEATKISIDATFEAAASTAQWNRLEAEIEQLERLSKTRANFDWTSGVWDSPWLSQSIVIRPILRAAHRRSSVLRCQGRSNDV